MRLQQPKRVVFALVIGALMFGLARTSAAVTTSFDIFTGTLFDEDGQLEDSYLSGSISFAPQTIAAAGTGFHLDIIFADSVTDAPQQFLVGAPDTGFPNPETFASREPGDCLGGGSPCSHVFGPGMIVSNSGGPIAAAPFTTFNATIELVGAKGLGDDFDNPYRVPEDPAFNRLCAHGGGGNSCAIGAIFPDMVDNFNFTSFEGLSIDFEFSATAGGFDPVTVDTFEFNILGASIIPGFAPPPGSFASRLESGSQVSISQQVDIPANPFEFTFEYLFERLDGDLDVVLNGVNLGTISALATPQNDFLIGGFTVDGSRGLLGLNDVPLKFTFDGLPGSSLLLDNIVFPGLTNGDFETGDLSGWGSTPGQGSTGVVRLASVPEPATLALFAFGLAGLGFTRRRLQ